MSQRFGEYPFKDPFLVEDPRFQWRLDPRIDAKQQEEAAARDLGTPISAIRFNSDTRRYPVCEGDWEFRVESANAPVLIIEGLKIRELYVKLAFNKPWPVDQSFTITGEADGSFCVRMSGSGAMTIDYRFACRKKIESRQVGIVLDLPKRCAQLTLQRDARWTVYPDDHIGRPASSTKSPLDGLWPVTVSGERPEWPWEYDDSPLGTNDFRATRDIPEDAE